MYLENLILNSLLGRMLTWEYTAVGKKRKGKDYCDNQFGLIVD